MTGGTFPKINLIGHSRGGLTNLDFAMDHPRLICSVFSLGTPYFGSNFANINILRESVVRGGAYLTDVQSTAEQNKLMNRWNAEYNTRFRNINVHAMAAYSNVGFLASIGGVFDAIRVALISPPFALTPWKYAVPAYITPLIYAAETFAGLPLSSPTAIADAFYSAIRPIATVYLPNPIPFLPGVHVPIPVTVNPNTPFFDDIFVGVNSQRGIDGSRSFRGFHNSMSSGNIGQAVAEEYLLESG